MLWSDRMSKTPRRWHWVDQDPPEEHGCKPSHVEHEVDFEAMTYVSRAWFSNPEIWAESETSLSSEHYEIERSAAGWMIRLVARNHVQLDAPHAWEPAPPALASAWDAAVS